MDDLDLTECRESAESMLGQIQRIDLGDAACFEAAMERFWDDLVSLAEICHDMRVFILTEEGVAL